jgi:hypothetical protein
VTNDRVPLDGVATPTFTVQEPFVAVVAYVAPAITKEIADPVSAVPNIVGVLPAAELAEEITI